MMYYEWGSARESHCGFLAVLVYFDKVNLFSHYIDIGKNVKFKSLKNDETSFSLFI